MKTTILITLFCATVLMLWPQTPPIPRETFYGIPPERTLEMDVKIHPAMTNDTCRERLLREHQWKYSTLRMYFGTNRYSWDDPTNIHRLHYCTNCGIMRIDP